MGKKKHNRDLKPSAVPSSFGEAAPSHRSGKNRNVDESSVEQKSPRKKERWKDKGETAGLDQATDMGQRKDRVRETNGGADRGKDTNQRSNGGGKRKDGNVASAPKRVHFFAGPPDVIAVNYGKTDVIAIIGKKSNSVPFGGQKSSLQPTSILKTKQKTYESQNWMHKLSMWNEDEWEAGSHTVGDPDVSEEARIRGDGDSDEVTIQRNGDDAEGNTDANDDKS